MNDTYAAFHEFFEIINADSAELREEVYRLRYRVYCVENNFLDLKNYTDGMEKDEYDLHSAHILLKHRSSGRFIGTVRLILQDPLNPDKAFPLEKYMQIDPSLLDASRLPRQHVAEISRFAILHEFSRRRLEQHNVGDNLIYKKGARSNRRRFPNIGLALVVGIVKICVEHDINHWIAVMDPALNRLLSLFGSHLNPVGPFVNYHGLRLPYHVKLIDVLSRMYHQHHDVWELVTDYGEACPYSMSYIQPEEAQVFDNMALLNN